MVILESLMFSWRADEGGRSVAVAEGVIVYVLELEMFKNVGVVEF